MNWIIRAFWLVFIYNLLEDRHINDVTINNIFLFLFYKTKKFHFAIGLFSIGSQKTTKCDKNTSGTLAVCGAFFVLTTALHILTSFMILYWTDTWQNWNYWLSALQILSSKMPYNINHIMMSLFQALRADRGGCARDTRIPKSLPGTSLDFTL